MTITANLVKTKLRQVCNWKSVKMCYAVLLTRVMVGLLGLDQDTLVPEGWASEFHHTGTVCIAEIQQSQLQVGFLAGKYTELQSDYD